jgi:protein-S-isoprenylcysteine O-methyltransferase Ste14
MDAINIFVLVNIIATFGANIGSAKRSLVSSVTVPKEKPKTYLQKLPLTLSMLTLVALILAVFQIGTFKYYNSYSVFRLIGFFFYMFFSWLQIISYKKLDKNYSTEILINKNHQLVTTGPFRLIRHPQYISQILMDFGGAVATLSYLIIPLAIIEVPFLIMRALMEEKLLAKYFKNEFEDYKKKSGFMFPKLKRNL